jgi:hypothetical protein
VAALLRVVVEEEDTVRKLLVPVGDLDKSALLDSVPVRVVDEVKRGVRVVVWGGVGERVALGLRDGDEEGVGDKLLLGDRDPEGEGVGDREAKDVRVPVIRGEEVGDEVGEDVIVKLRLGVGVLKSLVAVGELEGRICPSREKLGARNKQNSTHIIF